MRRRAKELSQNFLVDKRFGVRMVDELSPSSDDTVVEVGPGVGMLSVEILKACRRLILVEKDIFLMSALENLFRSEPAVQLVNADILTLPLSELTSKPVLLISNLPFHITTPFIVYLVLNRRLIKRAVITFQKEVTSRLLSPPGTPGYSWHSVWMQTFFLMEKLFDIPPEAFKPRPSVRSTVLRLKPREDRVEFVKEKNFLRFLQRVFRHRKKKLANVLSKKEKSELSLDELPDERTFKIPPERYWDIFLKINTI